MNLWTVTADVVVLFAVALLLGVLLERLGQSALVGYLLAGLLLGPGGLNVIEDETVIRALAELGVALLLFAIGLEFSWRRVRALGRVAFLGGAIQMVLTAALVAAVCVALGSSFRTALALGLIVAPSSTACVLRVLQQRAELDAVHGRCALGILLFQDMALVPLVLAMTLLGGGTRDAPVLRQLASGLALGVALIALLYLVTTYVLPRLISAAAVSKNRELPLLLAITTCLASAWGAHALHLSPAIGAFVAGMLLAESPYATWIRADVSALRTVFVTLFFASIGMIDDLAWIKPHWYWLAGGVPAVVFGKALIAWLAAALSRVPIGYALAAGLCLAQTGEFSFLLAALAQQHELLRNDAFQIVVATTVLTLLATPFLIRVAPRAAQWVGGRAAPDSARADEGRLSDHVIVVGYGPAGKSVHEAVAASVPTAIVDLNPRAMPPTQDAPHHFVAGDATQDVVLRHLNVELARAMVITLPDHATALRVARLARQLCPTIQIFLRARYHRHAASLREYATYIADEEVLTGRELAKQVCTALGLPYE